MIERTRKQHTQLTRHPRQPNPRPPRAPTESTGSYKADTNARFKTRPRLPTDRAPARFRITTPVPRPARFGDPRPRCAPAEAEVTASVSLRYTAGSVAEDVRQRIASPEPEPRRRPAAGSMRLRRMFASRGKPRSCPRVRGMTASTRRRLTSPPALPPKPRCGHGVVGDGRGAQTRGRLPLPACLSAAEPPPVSSRRCPVVCEPAAPTGHHDRRIDATWRPPLHSASGRASRQQIPRANRTARCSPFPSCRGQRARSGSPLTPPPRPDDAVRWLSRRTVSVRCRTMLRPAHDAARAYVSAAHAAAAA